MQSKIKACQNEIVENSNNNSDFLRQAIEATCDEIGYNRIVSPKPRGKGLFVKKMKQKLSFV